MKRHEKPEEYIRRLEESNKDLRKQLSYMKYCEWVNYELEEDNKKLKDMIMKTIKENEELEEHKKNLIYINKKCNEHIDELEAENNELKGKIEEIEEATKIFMKRYWLKSIHQWNKTLIEVDWKLKKS